MHRSRQIFTPSHACCHTLPYKDGFCLQRVRLKFVHIRQDKPDNIVRKSLSFQKTCEPSPSFLAINRLERFQFLLSRFSSRSLLGVYAYHARQCFGNNIPPDPFFSQFPLDSVPAKALQADPRGGPLMGKVTVVQVAKTDKVSKHRPDDNGWESFVEKPRFRFGTAPRPPGEKAVRDIPGPGEFLFASTRSWISSRVLFPNSALLTPHSVPNSLVSEPVNLEIRVLRSACVLFRFALFWGTKSAGRFLRRSRPGSRFAFLLVLVSKIAC